jgi:hypothetical protein
VTVIEAKLNRRYESLVSDRTIHGLLGGKKKKKSVQLQKLTFYLLVGTLFATPSIDKVAHGVDRIESTNKLFKRC